MKILYLTLILTITGISLFGQKCLNTPKKYPVDTSLVLNERTQSLLCAILQDTTFKDIDYIVNEYYSPITYYNGKKIIRIKNKKKKIDTSIVNDSVIYDPLNINDYDLCSYSFDVKQSIDTSKLELNCSDLPKKKIIIEKSQIEGKCALSIQEPPIFSKDYTRAIIIVHINVAGGGGGYQLLYIFEDNIWKQVCSKCTWRS